MSEAEMAILALVTDGFFHADADGRIWRREAFGRTGKRRPIPERCADILRKDGYSEVRVWIGGIEYRALSHRIIWTAARGPIPDELEINHCNGRKSDNRLDNLEMTTAARNVQHSWDVLGHRATVGEINGRSKLTSSQVAEIRALYAAGGHSHRSLGRQFGVTHNQIGLIVRGERWSEFPA